MLSKNEMKKRGLVGVKKFKDLETGEEFFIDFNETPVFTYEECEKYKLGQPGAKNYSDMTEEERRVYSDSDEDGV